MNQTRDILRAVEAGELSADDALSRLKLKPFENLGYAQVDLHREVMQGASEVIYGAGKTAEQIAGIARTMLDHGRTRILVTRLSAAQAEAVADQVPLTFDEVSHLGRIGALPEPDGLGNVLVVTGGTSDIPVAEEAAQTAEFLGNRVQRAYDMGVAGLHRTLAKMDLIADASVIVAVAGMEGALASVVGGLADSPVIAVPTSVGYGASFGGVSALLSMLNSCASGVAVVNIDNGFGAGYMASMINHMDVKGGHAVVEATHVDTECGGLR
ncbi:nickel pincer cofactor biosynthesis protein LarB [Adlercreutzia murintestinalis]|uniref:nickel pincer cofactor biosynthesis protein LarB n=1 Tax=Adlercreutzia murintestinalis TaxID=2941325 RepID=UPI00203EC007|nr:nickel pincer cofactor biosynthesis protein LarB [Adlercreutzia murintestinalis]